MNTLTNSVGMIGFGRFGQLWATLLAQDFEVLVYDHHMPLKNPSSTPVNVRHHSLNSVLHQSTIFIAVPIHCFAELIASIAPILEPDTTIIDLLSVKIHPVSVMQRNLPAHVDIIATHPMFGPDSYQQAHRVIMMHNVRDQYQRYQLWKQYFAEQQMNIIEMTPEAHDQEAAMSQGITHLVGRLLETLHLQSTKIDTLGFQKLQEIIKQTCSDSYELFLDLQRYNPYSKIMLSTLINKLSTIAKEITAVDPSISGDPSYA